MALVMGVHPLQDIFEYYRKTPADPFGHTGMSAGLLYAMVALIPQVAGVLILLNARPYTSPLLTRVVTMALGLLLFLGFCIPALVHTIQIGTISFFGILILISTLEIISQGYAATQTKRYTFALLILIITELLFVGAAEIGIRAMGTFVTYQESKHEVPVSPYYVPHRDQTFRNREPWTEQQVSPEFEQYFATNSDRIFDEEVPEYTLSEFRILVFGDSFVQGIGAVDETHVSATTPPEYSWTEILESELQNPTNNYLDNTPYKQVRVINAGFAGSDIVYEYNLAKDLLPRYQPKLLIVCLNISDISDIVRRGGEERFTKDGSTIGRKAPFNEWLYGHSHLYRFYLHRILGYDLMTFAAPKDKRSEESHALEIITNKLFEFKALAEASNSNLLVVFHPSHGELTYGHFGLAPVFEAVSSQMNTINVLALFHNKGIGPQDVSRLYWPIDHHHTALGYMFLAECLVEEVIPFAKHHP